MSQVFVANPNKPQPIVDILTNNKEKLLKYLEEFHNEKGERESEAEGADEGALAEHCPLD